MFDVLIPQREKKLIIFDLGGVLIQNQGCQKIASWSPQKITVTEFNERWIKSEAVRDFEKGCISENCFADKLIHEFSLDITPEKLISEFSNFLIGFYDGAEIFLQELSTKYTLSTLSNTNSIHWKRITEVFFDDNINNINTANEMGIQSFQVNGIEDVMNICNQRSVL